MSAFPPKSANSPTNMFSSAGFRLGEDHMSEASDSDQSEDSIRRISLSAGNNTAAQQPVSKTQKRKARKAVGALTDELSSLLGAAFSASPACDEAVDVHGGAVAAADKATAHEPLTSSNDKKMKKRTRQNLSRSRGKRASKQHPAVATSAAVGDAMDTSVLSAKQSSQTGIQKRGRKAATEKKKRRQKRPKNMEGRAAKWANLRAAGHGDKMEIE